MIKLVAAIASERTPLRQTRVFRIFSTLAEYRTSDLPAALQESIARELQRITPLLATVVEDSEAATQARQASLVVLALFAPETPLLQERMVEHIRELPDGATDMDYFEFGCAERLLSGSDAWRSLMRELAERYLANPNPSCLTPVEQMALTRHLAFLWQGPAPDPKSVQICATLSPYGPQVVLDLPPRFAASPVSTHAPFRSAWKLPTDCGFRTACPPPPPSMPPRRPHCWPSPDVTTFGPSRPICSSCSRYPVPRELFGTWASNLAP
ncbi:MAG: hypothetical protein JNK87_36245 [Bryobacterales bacterium]|nr:hypothetical protein [Bryobacterales bacterium]